MSNKAVLTHRVPGKSAFKPRWLAGGAAVAGALVLAGCADLHDERYNWCQGQSCEPAPVVKPSVVPAKATHTVTLSADALFRFDRSGLDDVLPKGRAELERLATTLRDNAVNVKSLTITGHTDRLGSAVYNERLSLQRANTVREYLQGAGVKVPMQVRGVGEREPVSGAHCADNQAKASLIACLQPDRRVVVDIEGAVTK